MAPRRYLRKRYEFDTWKPHIKIVLHYYVESHARNRYDGDDEYYGVQVCDVEVCNGKLKLKWWHKEGCKAGKGHAKQRDQYVREAKEWLADYSNASYFDKPLMCNSVGPNHLICPNVGIELDGGTCCKILPHSWGYSGGMGVRPLPEGLICDLYKIMTNAHFSWPVPGSKLTLWEYWECSTGKAKIKLQEAKDETNT